MGPISAAPRARGGLLALVFASSTALLAPACDEAFPRELTAPPALAERVGFDARPRNATCVAPPRSVGRVMLQPAFGDTKLLLPVDLSFRGARAYVLSLTGTLGIVDRGTNAVRTALDLSSEGLGALGFALHPSKPYVYVALDTVTRAAEPFFGEVRRYESRDGGATFDKTTEQIVLRVERPWNIHGLGTLRFGADGLLYIGSGEGGRSLPRQATRATRWDPSLLLGSILRIDVDGATPYAIPPTNPFASGGGRPEIFAGGLRNPFRFTFDRATGELWAGDVGESTYEEVDHVELGKNYGWPVVEGPACFLPADGCDRAGLTAPVFTYERGEGASITGGFVYRGSAMPALRGRYVFGDYITGRVWAIDDPYAGPARSSVLLNADGPFPHILAFAEDDAGELYVSGEDGVVYAMNMPPSEPIDTVPRTLSATGCVDRNNPKRFAEGVIPYDVNMALWSDGLTKARGFAIPEGTTLGVDELGRLTVPDGSVLLKTFAQGDRLVETRLLMRQTGGNWIAYTYAWNAEQTDATRVDVPTDVTLPNGQRWQLPGPAQCFRCHTDAGGKALGLELAQLNRQHVYPTGRSADQLATLRATGVLVTDRDPRTYPRLPRIDGPEPAGDRARAYLQVNCSVCHQPTGGTLRDLDFRSTSPFSALNGCSIPLFEIPGMEGAPIIAAGDPTRSALFARMSRRGGYQMPPLGTFVVDPVATKVIDEWIRDLAACQ